MTVDIVVKIGGGVLAHPDRFEAALDVIREAGRDRRLLIVPGGGPFADTVRDVDRRFRLPDDVTHWMAILAMDQYAHFLHSRLAGSAVVSGPDEIAAALDAGHVPVLAPSGWLRAADPLPHTWDVTSDSIAAWVAGEVGAPRLVLVKPPGAPDDDLVDGHFSHALSAHVTPVTVTADRLDALRSALR